ncbi:MAG: PAS domain S-box protein [Bacteroidales bacterium]
MLVISGGRVVHANPLFIKTFGYSKNEINNIKLSEILITDKSQTSFEKFLVKAATVKSTSTYKGDIRVVDKNNNEHLCTINLRRCLWKDKASTLLSIKLVNGEVKLENRVDEKSLKLLDTALIASDQCVIELNIASEEFYISPAYYSMLGYNTADFFENLDSWLSLMHSNSLKEFKEVLEKIKKGNGFPKHWEHQVKTKFNGYKWFLCVWQVVEWNEKGGPVRLVGVTMDINERRKLQIEKQGFLETVSGFIKNSLDGFTLIDENGIVVEWNPVLEKITMIKRSEIVGRYISDMLEELIHNEKPQVDLLTELNNFYSTIAHKGNNPWQGSYVESSVLDGMYKPKILQHSLFTIPSEKGNKVAISVKDVTESKGSRLKLEKSDERLKLALNAGNLGIWDVDFVSGETYFSPMTFTIFGYKPWEIEPSNKHWKKIIHPEDYEWVRKQVNSFISSGSSLEIEFRVKRKVGDSIWILSKNKILRDNQNKMIRATGTISDITRQKNIEIKLLRNQEELKKNLLQHELISKVSYILHCNKNIESKNKEVIQLLGEFTKASRVYIFENNLEKDITVNTYEWCNKGIEPQIHNLNEVSLSMVLDWGKKHEVMMSWDLYNDLPPDFAKIMKDQKIQSFIILPLQVTGKHFGYIGLDECNYKRQWKKEEVELLKTISNLISFSFERDLIQKHYQLNEQRFRELTQKLPHPIFRVSLEGQLEFMNKLGCMTFGLTRQDIKKGFHIRQILSLREVVKLKAIKKKLEASAKIEEPILVTANTKDKQQAVFKVYIRPKLKDGEVIGLSGIALFHD